MPRHRHFCSYTHRQQGSVIGFFLAIVIIALMAALAVYAYVLNEEILQKFETRKWDIPAQVYSRPLPLSSDNIDKKALESWLTMLHYKAHDNDQLTKSGTFYKKGNDYLVHTRNFNYGDDNYPAQIIKITFKNNRISTLQSTQKSDKAPILEPVFIGGIYPESQEDREIVAIKDTPKTLIDALIATEDKGFYEHYGISLRGISRAALNNFQGGDTQGGSTLTQQLVKNFYLNSEKSLKRKATEAIMAILLERHYSKDDILQAYINEINLGQNGQTSINGFGIAARFYFNRPLNELRLDQYALLVGIAKGPSYYNPRKHPERATQRRNIVLKNMLDTQKISPEEYANAIAYDLDVVKTPAIAKPRFPDFLDLVKRELGQRYRMKDLQSAGLKVITTLDPIAQLSAETAIKNKLPKKNLQAALVSSDPKTGQIIAVVGSVNDFTGFNRAIDAKRQVGSLLKPIIYLMALESGQFNLASSVEDNEKNYQLGSKQWSPKNYDGASHGIVPLTTALANSYNQAAVNTGMIFGIAQFNQYLKRLDINDELPNYPAVMLGAVDLSPMQMLYIYQTLASGGVGRPLYSIDRVVSENGKLISQHKTNQQDMQVLDPRATFLTVYAMQSVIKEGTAKAAQTLGGDLNLAGKTGTTNDHKDAWFAGFSGNYNTVVWVGRDDNKPIGLTGGTGALPIWIDFMKRLNLQPVSLTEPDGIVWDYLENGTGFKTDNDCSDAVYLPFIEQFMSDGPSNCQSDRQRQAELESQQDLVDDNGFDDNGFGGSFDTTDTTDDNYANFY